jgi:RNA polymerase sigma-70 factor, ECF subfamily
MVVMDDDELIAAIASGDGDDTALRELFSRHAPWLAARLRKALPPDDVEDVLQETFIAVWRNAKTYQSRGTPGGLALGDRAEPGGDAAHEARSAAAPGCARARCSRPA